MPTLGPSRQKDRVAGRRTAYSLGNLLARAHSQEPDNEQVSISMDWVATLLAAAGAEPILLIRSMESIFCRCYAKCPARPRKLFWRYKANAQRAARDGDYKYLKILDNTFLFNVVDDPLERANLKERQKDVYRRLVREWYDWNATMLPEIKESFTVSFDGNELADHFGAKPPDGRRTSRPAGGLKRRKRLASRIRYAGFSDERCSNERFSKEHGDNRKR